MEFNEKHFTRVRPVNMDKADDVDLFIDQTPDDPFWIDAIIEASYAVGSAKKILLNHRVQQFSAGDVVKLAEILISSKNRFADEVHGGEDE